MILISTIRGTIEAQEEKATYYQSDETGRSPTVAAGNIPFLNLNYFHGTGLTSRSQACESNLSRQSSRVLRHPPRPDARRAEERLQLAGQLRQVMARHRRIEVVLQVIGQLQE
jgi:hypothetical protein